MATFTGECLGIYKAAYAWEAQGDDEVSMAEDQLVLLLNNSDSDWSKIRIKQATQDLEGPEGLVPAAYIEKAMPLSTVKAAYDYEASATGELTIAEGEVLQVYERDEEWILVEAEGDKPNSHKVGYIPANYVEEAEGGEEEASATSASVPSAPAIVIPDSPPRPAYMAPEERTAAVAASSDKSKQDPIEIWPVSLLDKKGKKKKGTLGVGNGAVFFTSESDKSPVQKWQSSDITECTLDSKAKQIQIDFGNSESLKFISKDAAEAIHRKIESSRAAADSSTPRTTMEESRFSTDSRAIVNPQTPRAMEVVSPRSSEPALSLGKPADPPKSVHFAAHASEIPPRPETPDDEDEYHGENAVALYDFVGDANDELTVKEGEAVWVLDRSNDDWWKCRNQQGHEGVVPAQYLELEVSDGEQENQTAQRTQVRSAVSGGTGATASAAAAAAAAAAASRAKQPSPEPEPEPEPDDHTDSEEERERERERLAKEKKERERKEKEKERRRAEREREEREREEREREEEEARAADEQRRAAEKKKAEEKRTRAAAAAHQAKQAQEDAARKKKEEPSKAHRKSQSQHSTDTDDDDPRLAGEVQKIIVGRQINKDNERQNNGRPSSSATRHGPPPTGKTRVWHDRTGQFRVEAEFKGYENGKIRLHKLNGVTIEVPASKMSPEDMRYIEKITGKGSTANDDDVPLGRLSTSAPTSAPPKQLSTPPQSSSRAARSDPPPRKPTVDWFEFFLHAGCDMDDCTRYAQSFERDKIDETILPDMKKDTLRALGLREGDIIRVMKVIEKRNWAGLNKNNQPAVKEQIQADERYALQLQEAILTGKTPPPPPGPLPNKAPTAPAPNLFSGPGGTLKDNTRRGRPAPSTSRQTSINVDENALASASTRLGNSPTVANPGSSNRTPSPNLIDVNSNTTSNTKAKSGFDDDDAWAIRPSSAKPTSPVIAVSPPAAPASAPPAPAPAPAPPAASSLEVPQRPATTSPAIEALTQELELLKKIAELKRPPSAPAPSLQAPAPPPVPSPAVAPSLSFNALAAATSAPLPPQQTGIYANTLSATNGVRGPFAPVPANEPVLLKPLIPTNTAMAGFVPTRPTVTGMNPQPLLSHATGLPQLSPFQPQPQPSLLQPQITAFHPQPMMMQPTGIPTVSPVMMQQTGMPFGFGSTPSPVPPVPPIPSHFATGQPMSFNPPPITTQPLGSLNFGAPLSASPPPADHSPANVFASMKSGNFGGQEHAAPSAPNYDALRTNPGVNPLVSHPTGWIPGMPTGYQYR